MKKLTIVFLILALLGIFVVLRLTNKNIFQNDAGLFIEAIENNANIISENKLNQKFLIVNLDNDFIPEKFQSQKTEYIPFNSLLEKENQKLLKQSDFKIALYSVDYSVSVKAFILLNQLGVKNLFILESEEIDNEIFQYKFRPDTTIQPEFVSGNI